MGTRGLGVGIERGTRGVGVGGHGGSFIVQFLVKYTISKITFFQCLSPYNHHKKNKQRESEK